jgi:hypothetical protein
MPAGPMTNVALLIWSWISRWRYCVGAPAKLHASADNHRRWCVVPLNPEGRSGLRQLRRDRAVAV